MLLDQLNVDLAGWTFREKMLLQLLVNEMRVPLRSDSARGPDKNGEYYREHSTIRRLLKPVISRLNQMPRALP